MHGFLKLGTFSLSANLSAGVRLLCCRFPVFQGIKESLHCSLLVTCQPAKRPVLGVSAHKQQSPLADRPRNVSRNCTCSIWGVGGTLSFKRDGRRESDVS